jgi:hypothetical protein
MLFKENVSVYSQNRMTRLKKHYGQMPRIVALKYVVHIVTNVF